MTQQYLKVQGRDGLVRDMRTKAIVNTNRAEFEAYVARRDAAQARQDQLDQHEEKLNTMAADMAEIKQLLRALLSNGG